jgi:hypothetical protein
MMDPYIAQIEMYAVPLPVSKHSASTLCQLKLPSVHHNRLLTPVGVPTS